jgi:hypothetical protein
VDVEAASSGDDPVTLLSGVKEARGKRGWCGKGTFFGYLVIKDVVGDGGRGGMKVGVLV